MPYPINQRAHQFNSIQSVPVSFGLWDTALKFLSPGPRSDVTDHLVKISEQLWTDDNQGSVILVCVVYLRCVISVIVLCKESTLIICFRNSVKRVSDYFPFCEV